MAKNWAIAIGINSYNNLQALNYAKRDAEAMRDWFEKDARFDQVFLFTEDSPAIPNSPSPISTYPTYANLRRFLRVNFEKPLLERGDNLWFFFAGHGCREADKDYLMLLDSDRGDVEHTAISVDYVTQRLRRAGADNVVLFLDACRNEGSRGGLGIGGEHPGVITFYSCSPKERAYEIEALKQGSFTYSLLEALRIQGEGNCATVERLYQRLCDKVPELNRRYNKPTQTPYTVAEPATKLHLILLPKEATLRDIIPLKNNALEAETEKNLELAEQLWIRVLAVSSADLQAIKAIKRLALRSASTLEALTVKQPGSENLPISSRDTGKVKRRQTKSTIENKRVNYRHKKDQLKCGLENQILAAESQEFSSPFQQKDDIYLTKKTAPSSVTQVFEFEVVTVDAQGKESRRYKEQAQYFTEYLGNRVMLEMVYIPGGTFLMGSPEKEERRLPNEGPQQSVNIKPFFMSKCPITQAQWTTVASFPKVNRDIEPDPSHFKGANQPVEQVSWYDAVEFCARLSAKTEREYRLPTEAEWEYACRGGTTTPFHFGETITPKLANYDCNYSYRSRLKGTCKKQTTPVDFFPFANAFGLFDMHGNICEWCLDNWHDTYNHSPTDSSAWLIETKNNLRVLRGGSWFHDPRDCRSAFRHKRDSNDKLNRIGFRIICTLVPSG
jgi:formylglycine-generating enzyme required for sulfatase activity/uncharacterized caspase-like protein